MLILSSHPPLARGIQKQTHTHTNMHIQAWEPAASQDSPLPLEHLSFSTPEIRNNAFLC